MILDTGYAIVSAVIPATVLTYGLGSFGIRFFHGRPDFLDSNSHPATTWGFGFWLSWWTSMAVGYGLMLRTSPVSIPLLLWILNFGDLALIAFSIAYCGGNSGLRRRRFAPLLLTLVALTMVYSALSLLDASVFHGMFMIYTIAPSIMLASIANLVAGWAFLVRWGMTGAAMFIVALAYAACQGPAYHILFVIRPHLAMNAGGVEPPRPETVFYILAIGKLFLAALPIAFFLSTTPQQPDMSKESYWPTWQQAVPLRPGMKKLLLSLLPALSAFLASVFSGKLQQLRDYVVGLF